MKAPKFWMGVAALIAGLAVGVASAKLPPLDDAAKAKAAEAKEKAAAAAKKGAEDLAKAMDRVVERYKREKGMKAAATPAMKK